MLVAMVNKEIIMETVRKMYDSGIEDSVIEATLRDIGLNDEEIVQYIAEAKGAKPQPIGPAEEDHNIIAEKTAERIKQHLADERDERELRETTHQAQLDEHYRHLANVEENVGMLYEKIESLSTASSRELGSKIDVLEVKISALERQLADLRALSAATKDLMDKVLEVNRKILTKL